LAEGVRFTTPRFVALVVIVGAFSQSPAVAEQMTRRADTLAIGVTVDPICTIAVIPNAWTADEAVNLACRNLPDAHPEPQVTRLELSGIKSVDGSPSLATVVINF
jgi:hypothetical protein